MSPRHLANVATMWLHSIMVTVGIRELKNNLSRYLREVAQGARLLVTDRGRVVAEIGPPSRRREAALSRLEALIASGQARPPVDDGDPFEHWSPVRLPKGTAQRLLDEDRGER